MKFEYLKAKNEELTCKYDGKFLHSAYNPSREAQSFCENIKTDFNPRLIIIIEPALSYCQKFLKEKFPHAKLCAISLFNEFNQNQCWDISITYEKETFSQTLFNLFTEEELISSLILTWNNIQNIFPQQVLEIYEEFKIAVQKGQKILYTRAFFGKRWFINSVKFFKQLNKTGFIKNIKSDVLITASGPSLSSSLIHIKNNRNKFFLIALSSSLSVLLENCIKPDLIISTDGGYWAKLHLQNEMDFSDIPVALCDEGNIPSSIFKKNMIIPLIYKDSSGLKIAQQFLSEFNLAERNGTVAGTAIQLALELSQKNVYVCGFDQGEASGYQHSQPNRIELNNASKDFRFVPKEKRTVQSRFNSKESLQIYRNWFSAQKNFSRVKRLSDHFEFTYSLEKGISDINWEEINFNENKGFEISEKTTDILEKDLLNLTSSIFKSDFFNTEVFPLETLKIQRCLNPDEKQKLEVELTVKKQKLYSKIEEMLND